MTDMVEENPVDVPVNGGKVAMTFRPFEINPDDSESALHQP